MVTKSSLIVNFPRDTYKTVLSLPVVDLLSLANPEVELTIRVYSKKVAKILRVNPFLKVDKLGKSSIPRPRRAKVVDLAKTLRSVPGRRDQFSIYERAVMSINELVEPAALRYFLSGSFPRSTVWFTPEQYDYIELIGELTGGDYILLAVDVTKVGYYWSLYAWADLVNRLIYKHGFFVLISSNDDGGFAEVLSNLYRESSLGISYRTYYDYVLALMSRARVVVGNDLEQVFWSAYLRDGTVGLVRSERDRIAYKLWEEENYLVLESKGVDFVEAKVVEIARRINAKSTREEKRWRIYYEG